MKLSKAAMWKVFSDWIAEEIVFARKQRDFPHSVDGFERLETLEDVQAKMAWIENKGGT